MSHQNYSKSKNQWKYTLIFSLILTFLFSTNTKIVAQSDTEVKETAIELEALLFTITKNTDKETFEKIKIAFAKEGVIVDINKIKRNVNDEITSIRVDMKSETSNISYNLSSDKPMKPFDISCNERGEDIAIITSSKRKKNKMIFIKEDGHDGKSHDHNTKVWISKNGERIEKNHDTHENIKFNSGNKNKSPLVYLDGKEISKEEMEKIDPNTIESMNVYKGEKAIEKYGEKGKDGVIAIHTKK